MSRGGILAVGSVFLSIASVPASPTNGPAGTVERTTVSASSEARSLHGKAVELTRAGRWHEAEDIYRQILRASPADLKAEFGLGSVLIHMRRFKEARDVFVRLKAQEPDSPVVNNNLAWIYVTSPEPAVRNIAEGVKLAQQAVIDAPGDAEIWNTLAEAHYAAADYRLAQRAARIAVQVAQEVSPAKAEGFWETLRRCNRAVERDGAGQ